MVRIVVTSQSELKLLAVKSFANEYGLYCEVVGMKTPTTIEQPEGIEQTSDLAIARSNYLIDQKLVNADDLIISIESGLIIDWESKCAEDMPCISIMSGVGSCKYDWGGAALSIPDEYFAYVEEAKEAGFETTTFGEVLHKHTGTDAKNWQRSLCNMDRANQVQLSLEEKVNMIKHLYRKLGGE
ncbi:MAG: DUF84 family protein [Cyanobacteria bacterium J06642_11]